MESSFRIRPFFSFTKSTKNAFRIIIIETSNSYKIAYQAIRWLMKSNSNLNISLDQII